VSSAGAAEFLQEIKVSQLGTYTHNSTHYVWFSQTPQECLTLSPQSPAMSFDETQAGGKSMMATLMSALLNDRKVSLRSQGCQILEVYLR
jgi:hypothetical protein